MSVSARTILALDASPFCGGAQESLWTWGEALRQAGEHIVLLTADVSAGGLADRAEASGWELRRFSCRHWRKSPVGLWQMLGDTQNFARQSELWRREISPVCIYANGWRAAWLWRHSPWKDVPCLFQDRDVRMPGLMRRHLASAVSGVVGATECVLGAWRELLPAERCHLQPNGFDLARLRERAQDIVPSTAFTAVMVADLVPWKNHRLFLEALAALCAEGIPVQGVLVGRCRAECDVRYLQSLQDMARHLGLESCLRWLTDGTTSGVEAIAAGSVLVSCAAEESFGRTVVEALALGKPVVAVTAGGVREILTGCPAGTLCEGTPSALAAALARWRDSVAYAAAAASARDWADRYEMSRLVPSWQSLLHKIAP